MPDDGTTAIHERFMRAALEEAQRAAEHGETAVAALVTHGGEIVAISGSRVDTTDDPRAHAEMTVIGEACGRLGRARLRECTLYTTMEPCPMCGWAIPSKRSISKPPPTTSPNSPPALRNGGSSRWTGATQPRSPP